MPQWGLHDRLLPVKVLPTPLQEMPGMYVRFQEANLLMTLLETVRLPVFSVHTTQACQLLWYVWRRLASNAAYSTSHKLVLVAADNTHALAANVQDGARVNDAVASIKCLSHSAKVHC